MRSLRLHPLAPVATPMDKCDCAATVAVCARVSVKRLASDGQKGDFFIRYIFLLLAPLSSHPFPTDPDTLNKAQNRKNYGTPDANALVGRDKGNRKGRKPHQQ